MQPSRSFAGKNASAIVVYSLVCGLALSWLVIQVMIPMLTTPVAISLNLSADLTNIAAIVNLFFQLLITVLILFAVIHNGLDLVKKARIGETNYSSIEPLKIRRFDLNQRIQHIWLFTTTFVLAFTGFAQLYYSSWGYYAGQLLGGQANLISVHLLSAFFLGALIVYHFAFYGAQYVIRRRQGNPVPLSIMIGKKDITDFIQSMKYMIGRGDAPKYPKYDYAQKFDYWGIYWGMIILGVPGLLLWMYGYDFLNGLPFVMHTDEAMLAVLFLMVFHFYQTHFNPRYFPLNKVFITGRMSEKDMQKEHPLELEKIKSEAPKQPEKITVSEK
jgi:formate dehydrogenase subunit gamma